MTEPTTELKNFGKPKKRTKDNRVKPAFTYNDETFYLRTMSMMERRAFLDEVTGDDGEIVTFDGIVERLLDEDSWGRLVAIDEEYVIEPEDLVEISTHLVKVLNGLDSGADPKSTDS